MQTAQRLVEQSEAVLSGYAAQLVQSFLGINLLFIPVNRAVGKEADNPVASRFDGRSIIQKLKEMKDPEPSPEAAAKRDTFAKVQRFVRTLLGDKDLLLTITASDNVLMVQMHGRILPLSSYGSGLEHVVILASALAMFAGKTVLLEEPETNLHPELQRQLARFIELETTHRYFITTHSNVFLDLLPAQSAVYHVRYDGNNSYLQRAETSLHSREILSDMGFRASDLLQANGVIWVEGPSDRIYLNAWLRLADPTLVEGIHYAIAFYGGRILSHFTAVDVPLGDLVQVLRINRHAVMMIDRDGETDAALLNSTKQRILEELGPDACWVTEGREVENYLSEELVRGCLKDQFPDAEGMSYGKDDSFAAKFKTLAGTPGRYDKVKYASLFSAAMTTADLNVHDLRVRLTTLVTLVHVWNRTAAES